MSYITKAVLLHREKKTTSQKKQLFYVSKTIQ